MNKLFLIPIIVSILIIGSISQVDAIEKLTVETNHPAYYDYSGDVTIRAIADNWEQSDIIKIEVSSYSYDYVGRKLFPPHHGGWYPNLHYSQLFSDPTSGKTASWTLEKDKFPYYPNPITWKVVVSFYPFGLNSPPTIIETVYFDTAYTHNGNCWAC